MPAIDPLLLRTFLAVVRAGSITAAAVQLHRSQPAVTAALQRLEGAFGEPLFDRGARGVRLTHLGHRLRPHAEALEWVLSGVNELARETSSLGGGVLRIAASTTIALYWLPPLLGDFHRRHPALRVAVRTRNSREAMADLAAGDVDLALVEGPAGSWAHLPGELLQATPVHSDELVVIAPAGHPWARRAKLRPHDLHGVAFVGREAGSGTRDIVDRVLGEAGVVPDVRLELSEPEAMKLAVAAGMGVAVMSRIAVEEEVAAGRLAALPCDHDGLRRDFTLLHPPPELASQAARAFVADALGWDERRPAKVG